MSLLLEALQRASREKAGISPAKTPVSPPNIATSSVVASAGVPAEPVVNSADADAVLHDAPALSLTPADWPVLKPTEEPSKGGATLVPEAATSVASEQVLEASTPASTAGTDSGLEFTVDSKYVRPNPAPSSTPAPIPNVDVSLVASTEPLVAPSALTLVAEPAAPTPAASVLQSPAGESMPDKLGTSPSAVKADSLVASDRVRAEKLAQDIQRAHAPHLAPKKEAPWQLSRLTVGLGLVAAVLALGGGSLLLGLWGDPAVILGFQSPGLTPVIAPAPVPAVPQVTDEVVDATVASAAQSAASLPSEAPLAGSTAAPVPASRKPDFGAATIGVAPLAAPNTSRRQAFPVPRENATTVAMVGTASTQPRTSSSAEPPKSSPQTLGAKGDIVVRPRQDLASERGYEALRSGELDVARTHYETALKINAQDRDALLGLAYIAAHQGRATDAHSLYQEVLRFEPSDPTARAGMLALEAQSGVESSLYRARDLAQRQPESASALSVAAAGMAKEGQLAEAAQLYARAQALEPQNVSHAFNHAVALDRLGQYANALVQYEVAVRLAGRLGSPVSVESIRQRIAVLQQALSGGSLK